MRAKLDNRRRVAVIGTGVSGLVSAAELHRAGHEITVYEADDRLGGHSNTVSVETPAGPVAVDTGFIVLNDRNYPNLERLLADLDVPTQPAPMSFSVSDGRGDFEWAATPGGLFAKAGHLFDRRFHRMLRDLIRFNREARELIGGDRALSLRDFCRERGFSEYFVERLMVPQASAVWSADPAQLWDFPVSFLAEFLHNHGALQLLGRPKWRSVTGGSRSYVEAISAPWRERVRLRSPVWELTRVDGGVEVTTRAGRERFDEVVVAAHADQALAMLTESSRSEREVLGAIEYQPNETVLHTDTSLMPRRRRAWASWNFHLMEGAGRRNDARGPGRTTVTYDMNRLQRLDSPQRYLVTLNRTEAIDPARIIRRFSYSHPVYTPEAVAAQARWGEISGHSRIHYCGAYWGWGFHEDGVTSALRACERVGSSPAAPLPLAAEAEPAPLAA